jgi:CRISPR-associated exonuclease Cas4
MNITGTHINYYFICKRKLWLFSGGIQMEHTSELVYEGKLIHESSYPQRSEKYEEVQIGSIKVDFYDPKNKIIHEIKKSDKVDIAHQWQLKYYIYIFLQAGIDGVTGILEYPKLRKTDEVFLSSKDIEEIKLFEADILKIISEKKIPEKINSKICKNCSYFDFCYVQE